MEKIALDRYLNIDECSELLGVRKSWLYARTRKQEIPHYKLGKYLRFDLEQVRKWLEHQRRGGREDE